MGKGKHDPDVLRRTGFACMTRGQRNAAAKLGIIPPVRSDRERQLRTRYNLTLEEYQILLDLQGGRCACCGQEWHADLYVEHNHTTGKVRALCCARCNNLIRALEGREQEVKQALSYLEYYDD